jgi:hypothetical protein
MLKKIFRGLRKIGISVNLLIKHIGDIIHGLSKSMSV